LWSGLAFFLSFIPLVGTAPIMLGAVAYAFMQDRPGAGAALVVGVLVVGAVDNVLRPFFVKGRAALSFFWVFVAFIGGIAQFGVAGTVLGPLFFALFAAAAKALQESDALEEALAAKERVLVDSESDPGGASAPSVTSESP
jgi:predicted PurR-regulated permease PerM